MNRDCKHGQLARSCNICDLEAQIKEDEALLRMALGAMLCAVPTGKITLADWHNAITALRERLGEKV